MLLGTMAAYAFSRFKVPLKDDLLFSFIHSNDAAHRCGDTNIFDVQEFRIERYISRHDHALYCS